MKGFHQCIFFTADVFGNLRTRLLLFLFFVVPVIVVNADPTNYTYNYDYWNEQVPSPDAYYVGAYVLGSALGIDNFRDPQGLFIRENRIYICDSGNNRIVLLEVQETGEYALKSVVSSVSIDGADSAFSYPMDVFETEAGDIFIADTNNQRIVRLDKDWNYVSSIIKPVDGSIDVSADFLPAKLVVDFAGRVFVQARNVNKGLMEFDRQGSFIGYMGANKVQVKILDYVWKMISTQAQRAAMDLFIPTEYNNVALDSDGFIYVTNSSQSFWMPNRKYAEVVVARGRYGSNNDAVRRLNARGSDILIRNGYANPVGDLVYGNAGGITGPSKFIDVVAFENEAYACLDRVRGRIFMYDFQGNLLYAFGGIGNREGYFLLPTAIEKMGYSLFVLDARTSALTRFDLTKYGDLINVALNEYKAGRYEESATRWEEVLKMNGNYDLAYIGIGRAALRQGEYQKAMKYYKFKRYDEGYGKAFQLYRKQWMEENLWKILLVLGILIVIRPVIKSLLKIRKEIMEA
jgi:tetratricopeptide (TPR) repeat protein